MHYSYEVFKIKNIRLKYLISKTCGLAFTLHTFRISKTLLHMDCWLISFRGPAFLWIYFKDKYIRGWTLMILYIK